jgi:hypothetical protein
MGMNLEGIVFGLCEGNPQEFFLEGLGKVATFSFK